MTKTRTYLAALFCVAALVAGGLGLAASVDADSVGAEASATMVAGIEGEGDIPLPYA